MEHLEKIAEKASQLELQRFTPLLKRMEDTWGLACPPSPASSASEHESGESTGFDDDDDEETEEDRAFIDDDDELEQEYLSFCRRVELEWGEPVPLPADCREPAPPPPPKNRWRKKNPNGS